MLSGFPPQTWSARERTVAWTFHRKERQAGPHAWPLGPQNAAVTGRPCSEEVRVPGAGRIEKEALATWAEAADT